MTSLEPRSPVIGWGSGGGGAPSAHAPSHASGGTDPVTPAAIGALATTARGTASGVGSLTSAGRQPTAEAPLVSNPVRLGNVTSTVTSDASSGAGNLINLNLNGNITIVAPVNPTDHQVLEHHCVAVGADRTVTFTGNYVLAGAVTLGPYTVPRGKVLVARSAYLGNRADAADATAPAWGLMAAEVSDAPRMTAPHAGAHASGGSDPVSPAAIGAASAVHTHAAADLTSGVLDYARLPTSPLSTKTGAYTLVDADNIVLANTTSAAFTVTLPTAVGRTGKRFLIKKTGANQLTIASNGGTIDGAASEIITITNGFREVVSDGTNWWVTGGKIDPVIAVLANVGAGGTITINPAQASVYRVSVTGSTATLANPTGSTDGDVINVEILATAACTVTFNASIILAGGIASSIAIPINKRWFGAMRYITSVGWILLASSVQN